MGEVLVESVGTESLFEGGGGALGGMLVEVAGKSFASSWIEGNFVASDVRRETGGERYPSSPLDGRRSSVEAIIG